MVQFVKFLALTIGLVFSGSEAQDSNSTIPNQGQEFELTNQADSEINNVHTDTLKKDVVDLSKVSQIPLQPSDHHGCGLAHAHEVMRSEDPNYDKKLEHFKNVTLPDLQKRGKEIRASRSGSQATPINMPIVFHIIHRPGEAVGVGQNLSDQTIVDQLETLNEDLAALNAGWPSVPPRWESIKGNPEMQFCLAEIDPNGAPTTGIVRHEYASVPDRDFIRNTIKPQTHWNTREYYNVWILPIPGTSARGGILGWAFFPSAHGANFDGTVQDYRFTGKGGKTLTHEVGHSFGLPHLWGSGGCGSDDNIADTPPQEENTNSIQRMSCNGTTWPAGPNTCGEEHMYINYMDYSPDACALTFTVGQSDAMRGVANGIRASLAQNTPSVAALCQTGSPTGGGNPTGGGGPIVTIDHDAGIDDIISPIDGEFCGSTDITPVVLLTGFGDVPLTSCVIRYKISGVPGSVAFNWTGNLAKGETLEVALAPFTSPEFSFELTAWTTFPNGETDELSVNDERAISLVVPDVFDPNIFEDFEDESNLPTSSMIEAVDPGSTIREWEISQSSAYGVGEVSAFFRNFQDPQGNGQEDILLFPLLNFEEIENPRISFDLAYYDTNNIPNKDTLLIRVSTDCGNTFTTVYKEGGENLATVSQQQAFSFTPEPNEWKNVVVDLFDFSGTEKMLIEFVNIGYGNNNLYLDNLNLSDGCASNVQVVSGNLTCPDECDGFVDLLLNGFVAPPQITWSNNVNGQSGQSLDNLCPGTYSVTVIDTEFDCEFIQEIEITAPEEITLVVSGSNISLPGLTNGSAQAIVFGGTGFFTYEWSNDPSNEDFLLGLSPGEYCVTATDQAGCFVTGCYEVTGFDCEIEVELVVTQPDCGQSEGSAELLVTGANNPSFIWLTGISLFSTTSDSGPIGPGSYIVRVEDSGLEDCTETFQFVIHDTNPPTISPAILNESAAGLDDGSITLNVNDEDDFTYSWSTGTSTSTVLADIGAGTYMVTMTNVNTGCDFVETFNLSDLGCTIQVAQTITNISCFGETDGTVALNASGGVAPYTYDWPTGPSFGFRNSLEAGIYPVTVTDNDDCRSVVDVVVAQPSMLTAVLTATGESSPGTLDGGVSAQIFGGTLPYDIDWSTGAADDGLTAINNLGGGLYFITITDVNGCSTVAGASVEGRMCPDIIAQATSTDVSCFDAADGTLSVTAAGGEEPYTYLWTPGNYDQANVSNVPPGVYTVTVTDADDCPTTAEVTITQPAEFTVMLNGENESSLGAGDGSINSSIVGGVGTLTYAWSGPSSFPAANSPNLQFLSPGQYCVVVTDETNCVANACFTIDAGADPCSNFSIVDFDTENNICNGGTDGLATVQVEGGILPFTYSWSDLISETETASMLPAGVISVTVTDANGCTTEGEVLIMEPLLPLEISATQINESAPGANNGMATANLIGGDAPYSYVWTGPNGFTAATQTIENLGPGQYCVTGTDGNGCESATCVTVAAGNDPCASTEIEVEVNADIITCNNPETEVSFTATGGTAPYTALWSVDNQTSETISVDESGQISIIVTDANGCVGEAISFIEQDISVPQFTLETNDPSSENASDGSAFLTNVTPGSTTATWLDDEDMPIGEDLTIDGLAEGTYTVVLTNSDNGCTNSETFELEAEMADCASFSIDVVSENISCLGSADGNATIDRFNGTGPFTYDWEPALPDSPTQSDLAPGIYAVTVTDANGCMDNLSFEISDPEAFTVSFLVTEVSGPGQNDGELTAMLEGGVPDFTYTWSTTETGQSISGLSEGIEYCVTVEDGNGCIAEECITLEVFSDVCADFEVDLVFTNQITCFEANDGALQVNIINAVEPVTYEWSNGLPGTQQQTDLEPGVYSVLVTDANNCVYESSLELTEPESELLIDLSSTSVSSTGATDGSATVIATGGHEGLDFVYIWDDPNQQSTATATGLSPGVYCVTVASGACFAEDCIEVFDADNPCLEFSAEIITTDVSCFDGCDGTAIINIEGGLEPYQFIWSDGVTGSQERDDLCGLGSVTVSDANGCSTVLEFLNSIPDELEVVTSSTNTTDETSNNGSASAAAFGGTAPYTYDWDNNPTGATITNLAADTYTVLVTDANGCTVEDSVVVGIGEDDCSEFVGTLDITNVSCFGSDDGSATVITDGGLGTLLYDWSSSNTLGAGEIGLSAGDFEVTVTDQNGCMIMLQGTVESPDEIVIDVLDIQATSGDNGTDGLASIAVSGGTGDLEITWSNGLGSDPIQDGLTAGVYTVEVEDENGCTTTETITILDGADPSMEICDNLTASFAITPVSCFNELDGSIEVFPAGGAEPYDISSSVQSFTGLQGGLITITVEDANGCVFEENVLIPSPDRLGVEPMGFDGNCGLGASAEAIIQGGTAPFTVNWDNGATSTFINGLESGTYGVTVVDVNGCEASSSVEVVREFNPLSIDVTTTDASCDDSDDGRISIIINDVDDSSGIEFLWDDGVITQNRLNLVGGSYIVTITDASGCEYILSREIRSPDPIVGSFSVEPGSTSSLFDVSINATGGSGVYSFDWSDNSIGFLNTGLAAGEYEVTISDTNGCTAILPVNVNGTVAVSNSLDIVSEFEMSPNPTTGAFFLDLTLTEVSDIQVSIFDILGRQVVNNTYRGISLRERIDLQDQAAGTYFVRIRNGDGQLTKKLIKVD